MATKLSQSLQAGRGSKRHSSIHS